VNILEVLTAGQGGQVVGNLAQSFGLDRAQSAAVLGACRPNPFNPSTTIPVELGAASRVTLTVHDLRGRRVRTLVDGELPAGRTEVEFRADGLGSGTYLCTLECGGTRQSRRLVLVR